MILTEKRVEKATSLKIQQIPGMTQANRTWYGNTCIQESMMMFYWHIKSHLEYNMILT